MGGGRAKKASRRATKPVRTAGKAIKKIGGSIRIVRKAEGKEPANA